MNENIEKTIRYVDASMSIEGMPLTEQDKMNIRDCLSGKADMDTVINRIKKGYGNYTEEREELLKDVTLDDVVASIQARKAKQ
jgi:uncharacterized membrane protein YukC